MASMNAAGTLAAALSAAQRRESDLRTDPLIDRLATALALPQPQAAAEEDDEDEELDLPMLVQGNRFGAIVPLAPIERRGREGRAALIGFGLGLILLVPIGVVLSNRLPDPVVVKADASASTLLQGILPGMVVTDEVGIRTTSRATHTLPVPAAPAAEQPASRPATPEIEVRVAVTAPPPVRAAPPPDHLADAVALLAKGDIAAARDRIQAADPDSNPLALLALAETFDPNMLAAWSIRGAHADAERARLLYTRALLGGVAKARQRLDALE